MCEPPHRCVLYVACSARLRWGHIKLSVHLYLLLVLVAGPPQLHVGVHLALLLGGDQLR